MYSPTREGIESLLSENHALKEEIAQLRSALKETNGRLKQAAGVVIGVWRHGDKALRLDSAMGEITNAQNIIYEALKGGEDD